MTAEQMQRAIEAERQAKQILLKLKTWVLLNPDSHATAEVVNVGSPATERGRYNRETVPVPVSIRRLAFAMWRKELALRYNALVREVVQLGATTGLRLIGFRESDGAPLVEGGPS